MTRLTDNLRTSCPHFPASLKLLLFYSVIFKQVLTSSSAVTGAKENVTLKRDHFEEGESKARGSLQPSRSRDVSAPDNDPIMVTCAAASIWTHSRLQAWTQTIKTCRYLAAYPPQEVPFRLQTQLKRNSVNSGPNHIQLYD